MKKNYKTPALLVTEIESESLICLSIQGKANSDDALTRRGRGGYNDDEDDYLFDE